MEKEEKKVFEIWCVSRASGKRMFSACRSSLSACRAYAERYQGNFYFQFYCPNTNRWYLN